MDHRTESQLRQEIDDLRRLVDQHKRSAKIGAAEREHAISQYHRAIGILVGIHSLLYPPSFTMPDGRTHAFRPKNLDPHATMQALSDRIRALPDEITGLQLEMAQQVWQPIQTAPRDGTEVLVYTPGNNGGQIVIAAWRAITPGGDAAWRDNEDLMVGRPTFWMLLPAPPAAT